MRIVYIQGTSFYPDAEVEPYFSNPTVKLQLGAGDALVNLIYIFSDGLLAIPVLVLFGLFLLIQGLATSRWEFIIVGVLTIPLALLSPFMIWLNLTFQSSGTAAYYILMALGIITAAPLGLILGGGGTVYTPVIIIRIIVE